jgi:predicted small lipoprotein YifL
MKSVSWILSLFLLSIVVGCGDPDPVEIPESEDAAAREMSEDEIEDEMNIPEGDSGDDGDL